ncbi:hypothetical protein WR25_11203 [Diploscapter pachys]|uniref:Uncharacterized protein n=1 Tax=Diploscapter pachys TaxID=2018661 RepID=A0A2A2LU73_9BILA|nr:hypothetical protein WR25_11203 [Diploscapter pachys]
MCWVVLASSKLPSEAIPLALITCVAVIIIYMWFAVIICMTFILIRDKKRLGIDIEDYSENRNIERASSSFL